MHTLDDDGMERVLRAGMTGLLAGIAQGMMQEMQQGPRQVQDVPPRRRQVPGRARRQLGTNQGDSRQRAKAWVDRTGGFPDVPYAERHEWKAEAEAHERRGNTSRAYENWTNYYSALRNR